MQNSAMCVHLAFQIPLHFPYFFVASCLKKKKEEIDRHTYDGGHHFKAEQWVVLEELHERKRDQRKILHLSEDGGPVSQGGQNPVKAENRLK